jgi:hypothetical protein
MTRIVGKPSKSMAPKPLSNTKALNKMSTYY